MKITKQFLLEEFEFDINGVIDFYNHFTKPNPNDSDALKNGQTLFVKMLKTQDNNQVYLLQDKLNYSLFGIKSGFLYASCLSNVTDAISKLKKWANENKLKIVEKP